MTNLKTKLARDWLPPALARTLAALRHGRLRFTGEYNSWDTALMDSDGYDAHTVLAPILEAHQAMLRGEGFFQRDGYLFTEQIIAWPILSTLNWVAARDAGKLRVLDIGGGLGSIYFQHRSFLDELPGVEWRIVEQQSLVTAATDQMDSAPIGFYSDLDAAFENGWSPNVVLLSSSMQYFEDPDQLLRDINSINARAIIIDRTPLHDEDPEHHLVVQHVPMSLDGGSYPCWILSRRRVFDTLHRWQAIADGISPEGRGNTDRGLHFEFSALILTPRHD